ncbi:hypothetical protein PHMEG_00023379 [Phytophthora megakarya]|uniref:Uncharacterized protein n=1 Tax=Phytophthora megakarya TaxID=4795 RepID=A0A225VGI8_9STRA|nr:hypothetical protein PHMEG_00023379 [Phytophthora megakarya]
MSGESLPPQRPCRYCGDAPCEWNQYGRYAVGSRLRMLTARAKRRTPRSVDQAIRQLYSYKKHGFLSNAMQIELPRCVQKRIERLNDPIRYFTHFHTVYLLLW